MAVNKNDSSFARDFSKIYHDSQFRPHRDSSDLGTIVLDHVNEAALAAGYQENLATPSPSSPENKTPASPPDSGLEESPEARLERLGRQRPEVFKSIYAEIGFVFSISMSQIFSVSAFLTIPKTKCSHLTRNISCLDLRSSSQH